MKKEIVIATRGSKLALWQAEHIKSLIETEFSEVTCKLNVIKTTGDIILDVPLAKIGGKGLFVKEIETAMLEGEADIAVHSMKDVPMELPEGLELFVSPIGETPNDAFLSINYNSIDELPQGAKVGTSSLRRKLQLLEKRPDLEILDLRGNVQTRMKKLEDGMYDAIILAKAGLVRLGLTDHIKEDISIDVMLPAASQGILGIEVRTGDTEITKYLEFIRHKDTETRMLAERAFLRRLQGGCQVPIACHSILLDDGNMHIKGLIYSLDGTQKIVKELVGPQAEPEKLGYELADSVLAVGGDKLLKEIYA